MSITKRVVRGQADDAIVDLARQMPGNLVVMTTDGRFGICRRFLGSVVDGAVRRYLAGAVRCRGKRAMSLLDLKTARYPWETINRLPGRSRNLDHHELLVDALREEFGDTLQ